MTKSVLVGSLTQTALLAHMWSYSTHALYQRRHSSCHLTAMFSPGRSTELKDIAEAKTTERPDECLLSEDSEQSYHPWNYATTISGLMLYCGSSTNISSCHRSTTLNPCSKSCKQFKPHMEGIIHIFQERVLQIYLPELFSSRERWLLKRRSWPSTTLPLAPLSALAFEVWVVLVSMLLKMGTSNRRHAQS